jgi:hypothetical protein
MPPYLVAGYLPDDFDPEQSAISNQPLSCLGMTKATKLTKFPKSRSREGARGGQWTGSLGDWVIR